MDWEKMETLEKKGFKGYIRPRRDDDYELAEDFQRDKFARRMLQIIFSLLIVSESYHFFQLQKEELFRLDDWSNEALLEAIYEALTKDSWPLYLYLENQNSLLVLNKSQACPIYSQNEVWLETLKEQLETHGLAFEI
ncbi:hypothetical protein EII38_03925 [Streptococcus minor]|uniref:Uncharacterized protein n=1 Tax=Streptococcus minor TaxID=229549 RepID=A0A3P1VDR6_9STRE|nr:hypothetical protein [Streptococcus minor]RRD31908.1 hypothetical protein EII38_03925 [Streptococcus minor]